MPVTAKLLFVLSTLTLGGQAHATLPAMAGISQEVIEAQMELDSAEADSQQSQSEQAQMELANIQAEEDMQIELVADKSRRRATRCRKFAGVASWYGPGFHGRKTASGERFNQNALTAAHRTLPFGTSVRVTNSKSGKSVIVRINDRGPFHGNRSIDLSKAAARSIGMGGVGAVKMEACI